MTRIASNYARLILTFVIGLYILKRLLSTDESLYSTYAIVVVGMNIGIMLREATRIALVSFLGKRTSNAAVAVIEQSQFRQALTVSFIVTLLFLVLSLPLSQAYRILDISPEFVSQFSGFVLLRAFGYAILLLCVPYINVFAYQGRMVLYNGWLILERIVDLVAVEVIIWSIQTGSTDNSLLVGGSVYAAQMIALFAFLMLCNKVTGNSEFAYRLLPVSPPNRQRLKKTFRGTLLLVITMALQFRWSLVIINALFGETVGVIYALAIQIANYLRQFVMGLVTGIDSLFSRLYLGNTKNVDRQSINQRVYTNCGLVSILSLVMFFNAEHLIAFFTSSSSIDTNNAVLLLQCLLIGITVRAYSETWISLLAGLGVVSDYARPLLTTAIIYQIFVAGLSVVVPENPYWPMGLAFILALSVSHLYHVPRVLTDHLERFTLRSAFHPVAIVCSAFLPTGVVAMALPGQKILQLAALVGSTVVWLWLLRKTYQHGDS